MKNQSKKLLCGLLACALLALTGCGSTVDNRDDPLSGYSVNALLPFGTRNPELEESPTPQPTATPASGLNTVAPQYTPVPSATVAPTGIPATSTNSYVRLEPGDTGDDVLQLQNRLIQLGYLTGTADGRYGTQTQNAVKLFQRALGISQTGIANVSLQERLFSINAPVYTPSSATSVPAQSGSVASVDSYPTLVRGDTGNDVLTLQRRLQELGYLSGLADGKFGGQTEAAIKAFQARLGLTQSGVASSSLQERLYAYDAPRAVVTAAPTTRPTSLPTVRPTAVPTAVPTAAPAPTTYYGYTDLTYGMKNSLAVQQMQRRLQELGYFNATATGNYYAQTAEAVRDFQTACGLPATGTATGETLAWLYSPNAPSRYAVVTATPSPAPTVSPYVVLGYGSRGDEVANLQKRLIQLGWASGRADGIYGLQTVSAVRQFQSAIGHEATGTATVEMQAILFSTIAPYNIQTPTATPTVIPTLVPTTAPTLVPTAVPTAAPLYTQLQPGSTGEAVKRLQTRLKELGYFNGEIGGNYLTKTTAAVQLFEAALGRTQTGIATVELQEILFSSAAPRYSDGSTVSYVTLEKGDSGVQVRNLQQRLIELGWLTGTADGQFGNNTRNAVIMFQSAIGLQATGVATPETQIALYAVTAPHAPVPTAVPTSVPTVVPTVVPTSVPTAVPTAEPTPAPTASRYTPMQPGESGPFVAEMQTRLKELGYFASSAAGNYQNLTVEAVRRFQAAAGLNPDGIASAETLELLYSADAPTYNPDVSGYIELSNGSSGPAVYSLQQRLIQLGWLSGGADGDFGNNTEKAVSAFQNATGLAPNGVADDLTQRYLYSSDAPAYVAPTVPPETPAPATVPPQQTGYQPLYPGDTGELVKDMQRRLKALGFFDGEIGGNYLTKTQAAVERFQAAAGFPVDGIASSALLELLYSDAAPTYSEPVVVTPEPVFDQPTAPPSAGGYDVLSVGSRGSDVKQLQQRLIELGWLRGEADGDYGLDTANAVSAFQYQIGQQCDGIADIEFQQRLYAADARASVEYVLLAEGARGQEVLAVQKRLIELGYLDNTEANTDGEYGPKLSDAIQRMKNDISQLSMQTEDEYLRRIWAEASQVLDGSADPAFQNFLFSDNALQFSLNPYTR